MKNSTKTRIKAVAWLAFMLVASPLFFLIAGVHEKWFARREMIPPQGTFTYGLKIMAQTYVDVTPELWNEIKFGVEILEK